MPLDESWAEKYHGAGTCKKGNNGADEDDRQERPTPTAIATSALVDVGGEEEVVEDGEQRPHGDV